MKNHTGQGQIIKANAITQDENGNWVPATPEPYYANWLEKALHFFGVCQWTYTVSGNENNELIIPDEPPSGATCVICNAIKP